MFRRVLLLVPLAACAQGTGPAHEVDANPQAIDGAPGTIDARVPDATPPDVDAAPPAPAVPLLLSEVTLAPTASEMIEIANPTAAAVDLHSYYLSDYSTYYRLPAGDENVGASDFIVRFPAGAQIPAHSVKVVALDTVANFMTAEGVAPDWSIATGTMQLVAGSAATLTNTGEMVALFYWDGVSDTVTDCDLMIAGIPTATNGLTNKSGVAIDGPDGGTTATAYLTDAMTIAAQATAPGNGVSTKRISLEAGHETLTGGNGADGHDETSEATGTTWDTTYTAPTPGTTTLSL